jgi:hypothetical protein
VATTTGRKKYSNKMAHAANVLTNAMAVRFFILPNVEAVYPASRGRQGWKNTGRVSRGLWDTLLLN